MAVSVRADLTPAEFDLVRRSLASHAERQQEIADQKTGSSDNLQEVEGQA